MSPAVVSVKLELRLSSLHAMLGVVIRPDPANDLHVQGAANLALGISTDMLLCKIILNRDRLAKADLLLVVR
jgi:hypothetical protein